MSNDGVRPIYIYLKETGHTLKVECPNPHEDKFWSDKDWERIKRDHISTNLRRYFGDDKVRYHYSWHNPLEGFPYKKYNTDTVVCVD